MKSLLDGMVSELIATQLPDGYLGTYDEAHRWTEWDVWAHKYNLIGLYRYYEVTGSPEALAACRKIADLLCSVFGDGPGKRDIAKSGEHEGMSSTSVLEPMIRFYRETGEQRYLDFCLYIVRAMEQPHGPKIIKALQETGSVRKTSDAKAYELMSNLVGLLELYRVTGDRRLLDPAEIAWRDITARRLYLTGTVSAWEDFQDDHHLPGGEDAKVGEACATVTWLQMNHQLFRLSGDVRYAEEIERTVFNQLLALQDPVTGQTCSYVPLYGRNEFSSAITCCNSSESRALAMLPQFVWGQFDGGLAVLLYAPGEASFEAGKTRARVVCETAFPEVGEAAYTFGLDQESSFPMFFRVPAWADSFQATVGGRSFTGHRGEMLRIDRTWKNGDRVAVTMELRSVPVKGGRSDPGTVALLRGPEVLAFSLPDNPSIRFMKSVALDGDNPAAVSGPVNGTYRLPGMAAKLDAAGEAFTFSKQILVLKPFADTREHLVWIREAGAMRRAKPALTVFERESASRGGEVEASICDDDPVSYRNTYDHADPPLDWYAVEMSSVRTIGRVVFTHGHSDPKRGGWFLTDSGKPEVQIKRKPDAPWETIASLDSYPLVAPGQFPSLKDGQVFEVKLREPVDAVAVRVIGRPARGTKVGVGASSSCAELAAYRE